MGKLKVTVGDEVYIKGKVKQIKERRRPTENGEADFWITVEIPYWDKNSALNPNEVYLTWDQHLLYTPEGEEA